MRLFHTIVCACAILSSSAFASDDYILTVDTAILERNISSCSDSVRKDKQASIDELKKKPLSDFTVYLSGAFMTKYVEFSLTRECSIGLLDNAILLLEAYMKTGSNPLLAKNDLAVAKLMRASFFEEGKREAIYNEADRLIDQYIAEEAIKPDESIATPFYFAAHSYLDGAELTNDADKIVLLEKALAIVKKGMAADIGEERKKLLREPQGIALGNMAKYYKTKDESKFRKILEQATQAFMEGFSSGDNLAAYNIAVNYSLLADAENTKKWLMVIEEKKALDKQICLQGLLADPDMAWFRANQNDWLVTYFRRNCMSFMPPMPAK